MEVDILGTGVWSMRDFTAESTNGLHDLNMYVEVVFSPVNFSLVHHYLHEVFYK